MPLLISWVWSEWASVLLKCFLLPWKYVNRTAKSANSQRIKFHTIYLSYKKISQIWNRLSSFETGWPPWKLSSGCKSGLNIYTASSWGHSLYTAPRFGAAYELWPEYQIVFTLCIVNKEERLTKLKFSGLVFSILWKVSGIYMHKRI